MGIRLFNWRIMAAIAAVVLVAAACGKSSYDAAGGDAGSKSTGVTADSSGSSGGGYGRYSGGNGNGGGDGASGETGDDSGDDDGDVTVTANNYSFDPAKATVASGSELYLSNANANTPHTFTIDGTDVDVALDPMSSEDVKIDLAAGGYDFHCKIHPSMTGTLTVT